ncbi:CmpA/NrtA family ABC transporter substrate-binding protein [Haloferula rosea]|uniref:ABC transporter substrate-binding protein n=1 Tax=Haloferula rosea TaxID=490093 RepID=A0A934RC99_9BACT|nr:CmpA/NrtA family ABC transporter substrate-binding protein [Haloferula rosea]MBK1827098.1 ABC transporter substrate-binding protein [Haloferula rosea]
MAHTDSRSSIRLGFVPLNDCAPVAVAKELGLFRSYGVSVTLSKQPGWATIRDMLFYGELDAAQSIAGIAFYLSMGLTKLRREISVPLVMSAHGNAITLSNDLPADSIGDGSGLAPFIKHRWKKQRPLTLAAAHRYSSHHILLHSWLRRHGVEPGRDVEIVFLPPPLMPASLAASHIDGYCVGEPWNSESILKNYGWCPATSSELSTGHPEKILIVDGQLVNEQRDDVIAMGAALLHACRLCQQPDFRDELVSILARPEYTGCSEATLFNSLGPSFVSGRGNLDASDFHLFYGNDLNQPTAEKASWFLAGMRGTGLLPETTSPPLTRLYRQDLFRASEKMLLPA